MYLRNPHITPQTCYGAGMAATTGLGDQLWHAATTGLGDQLWQLQLVWESVTCMAATTGRRGASTDLHKGDTERPKLGIPTYCGLLGQDRKWKTRSVRTLTRTCSWGEPERVPHRRLARALSVCASDVDTNGTV